MKLNSFKPLYYGASSLPLFFVFLKYNYRLHIIFREVPFLGQGYVPTVVKSRSIAILIPSYSASISLKMENRISKMNKG